ncbi:UTRA domain-containing protein [Niveispirillum sp. SYP-B3756]|uniref:UTRA domain-containing protein n=1 Tax=Niveispirillum sp. SYP-B3756 TaxID=2662178 RepID=UPI0012925393|nr:UTRA domain-containing protein [Niveispirillum sp. SYP-B3756]MQP66427.1 UTRA domain-containing protein [Niveispirillum sp. SYP-B3756]
MGTSGAKPWWRESAPAHNQLQYLELRDRIAAQIQAGVLGVGDRLPSERQLEDGLGSARGTVREALFQLEAEGLIYRRDRSGWYVCPAPILYDPTRSEGFMAYVTAQGRRPETETLSKRLVPAPDAVAGIFGVAEGTPLYDIRRLRSIDGRSVLVERIHVNPDLAPGLIDHSLDGSLTAVLKNAYGVAAARNRIAMKPCAILGDDAETLRARSGSPGLSVIRTSFDPAGRVVEYDQECWRHDAVIVSVDIRVAPPGH